MILKSQQSKYRIYVFILMLGSNKPTRANAFIQSLWFNLSYHLSYHKLAEYDSKLQISGLQVVSGLL